MPTLTSWLPAPLPFVLAGISYVTFLPFEWEGEWLIGIVDREWIVGNPDIDPSGLK